MKNFFEVKKIALPSGGPDRAKFELIEQQNFDLKMTRDKDSFVTREMQALLYFVFFHSIFEV